MPAPQVGPPGHTFEITVPQAMVAGFVAGQRGAHTHWPPEHVSPAAQRVPAPGHVRPGHAFTSGAPQATALAAGHTDTHWQLPATQA